MEEQQSEIRKESNNPEGSNGAPVFQISQRFSVLVIGLGIGWLAGLTIAPVTSTILTSVLGVASGVVVGLQTIQRKKDPTEKTNHFIDARPAALLLLGIAIAAPLGIMARTYELFEPKINETTMAGREANTREEQVVNVDEPKDPAKSPVLFGKYEGECDRILGLATMGNHTAFLEELKKSKIPLSQKMVERFKDDPETLEYFLNIICQHYTPK